MKKLTIATAILATSTALVAINANAYQAEVGASYSLIDPDHASNLNQFGANGKFYFKPVQLKDSPLAEAAFLDRASNVNANVNYAKKHENKLTTYGVGVDYFIPNTNFFVGAGVGRSDLRDDEDKLKVTTYNAEVGYLPINGLLIAVGAQGYKVQDSDVDGVDPTVRAKYVKSLANGGAFNVEANAVFGDDDNRIYNVAGDYYFNKTLSAGVDYQKNKALDQDQVGIRAKKFFNEKVSVEGRLGFGDNYNTYTIGANYRF